MATLESYEAEIQNLEQLIQDNEGTIANIESQIQDKRTLLANNDLNPQERQQLTSEISNLQAEKRTFERLNDKYRSDISYHIRQDVPVCRQTVPVKVSVALTTLFVAIGLINGICSILTFYSKETREVGCGLYLYMLSIISLFTLTFFTLKVCFLIFFQSLWIRNRSLEKISCISQDYLVQSLITIEDWLSVCVSIERLVLVTRHDNRTKKKTLQYARWIIPCLCLVILLSFLHDPLNRQLIDDEDDHRTWCIIKYSSSIKIYDSIIRIIHFVIPFIINFICALIMIINIARSHSNARKNKTYKQYLREQFNEHKHLIISPFILVILSLPRLIISFFTEMSQIDS